MEALPEITYFKPAGIPLRDLEEVVLSVEELEALRLHEVEGLDPEESARRMEVSRPTFVRALHQARQKIATAVVRGQAIRISGGNFRMEAAEEEVRRFRCSACGHEWTVPFGTGERGRDMLCPECQSSGPCRVESGQGQGKGGRGHCAK